MIYSTHDRLVSIQEIVFLWTEEEQMLRAHASILFPVC
jgi:hypothetical protein